MDFSQIDALITRLEKKKSLRPPSPPVVLNGHLGVWRTIRHHRMFIELTDGKKKLGRVLVGPPSFVNRSLGDVPGEAWQALTPRATKETFSNAKVADNGIETLKQSIKNSIGPDDTRNKALEDLDTVEKLVPIARSAGFTDDEIKQALRGDSPNKPLEQGNKGSKAPKEDKKPDSNVVPIKPDMEAPTKPAATPDKPKQSPSGFDPKDAAAIQGALALLAKPKEGAEDRDKQAGDLLLKLKKNIKDELLRKQVEKFAHGLRSGDYTLSQVQERLLEISNNKSSVKTNAPTPQQLQAIEDRADIKEFIDGFDEKLDEKLKQAMENVREQFGPGAEAPDSQRNQQAEIDAAIAVLRDLESRINNPEVKKEIKQIMESVSTNPFSKRSILLRLYQLLQLLLLFLPLP